MKIKVNSSSAVRVDFGQSDAIRARIPDAGRLPKDYNDLLNLPTINGVTVQGNMSSLDLFMLVGQAHDTVYWNNHPMFVPEEGEIIVYTDRTIIGGQVYAGVKVGDGHAYVVDLPFVGDDMVHEIGNLLANHINDRTKHVLQEEKDFWNNKLNYRLDEENLILNRL